MSSLQRKIRKNQENYIITEMYKNMTPEQYKEGIDNAKMRTKIEVTNHFKNEYKKLKEDYQRKLNYNYSLALETLSVELLYEIANQMNFWNLEEETEDDKYIKDSARIRIQEIYNNTMQSIDKYASMKLDKDARKKFDKRKKQVEKEFKIKF